MHTEEEREKMDNVECIHLARKFSLFSLFLNMHSDRATNTVSSSEKKRVAASLESLEDSDSSTNSWLNRVKVASGNTCSCSYREAIRA